MPLMVGRPTSSRRRSYGSFSAISIARAPSATTSTSYGSLRSPSRMNPAKALSSSTRRKRMPDCSPPPARRRSARVGRLTTLPGEALLGPLQLGRRLVPVVVKVAELDLDRLLLLAEFLRQSRLFVGLPRGQGGLELLEADLQGQDLGLQGADALAKRSQLPVAPVARLGVGPPLLPAGRSAPAGSMHGRAGPRLGPPPVSSIRPGSTDLLSYCARALQLRWRRGRGDRRGRAPAAGRQPRGL